MLIAASCPSNNDAAVTKRMGLESRSPDVRGKSVAAVLMLQPAKIILIWIKIMQNRLRLK
jgi:hypothetical protein